MGSAPSSSQNPTLLCGTSQVDVRFKAPVGLSHYLEITIPNKYLPCGSSPRKSLSEEYVQFTVAATTTPGRNTTTIPFLLSSVAANTVHSSKARQTTSDLLISPRKFYPVDENGMIRDDRGKVFAKRAALG
jgi:hypothetical protein